MYQNFSYYTPTRVIFGKGAEEQVGSLVKQQGCRKVLIHYGSNSAVRSKRLRSTSTHCRSSRIRRNASG